jgi:lysophospholipid acyltransferase (LPLAT)-like uncharacterized protein
MAIRSSWFKNLIVSGALFLFRSWWSSMRIVIVCADPAYDPRVHTSRLILSMWHEDLMTGCLAFRDSNLKALVSHSNDGDHITRTIEGIGFSTIRGSSKRGGAQAMREMIRQVQENCIAIMPDGPKGPRRVVKDGVTYLSSRSGAPIVALGCAYSRAIRFRSWDRMAYPVFSKIVIYVMPALVVPRDADRTEFDQYTAELQQRMQTAQERALELLADWQRTGKPPEADLSTGATPIKLAA